MDKRTIDLLKGMAYDYCNEDKKSYAGGVTMPYKELNKPNFEKISAFLNWIEATQLATPEEDKENK